MRRCGRRQTSSCPSLSAGAPWRACMYSAPRHAMCWTVCHALLVPVQCSLPVSCTMVLHDAVAGATPRCMACALACAAHGMCMARAWHVRGMCIARAWHMHGWRPLAHRSLLARFDSSPRSASSRGCGLPRFDSWVGYPPPGWRSDTAAAWPMPARCCAPRGMATGGDVPGSSIPEGSMLGGSTPGGGKPGGGGIAGGSTPGGGRLGANIAGRCCGGCWKACCGG